MSKRIVLPLIAAALGMGLLVLTFLIADKPSGSAGAEGSAGSGGAGGTGQEAAPPPPAQPWNIAQPGTGAGKRFQFTQRKQNGQIYHFTGEELIPLPNDVARVVQPVIRIHLLPNRRVVEIRAREGELVMPGQQPKRGRLSGEVRVTLYESPVGQRVRYGLDSPHARLRLSVPEARFDTELGTVETDIDQPVHLTGGQFDFRGRGLKITFNELHRRMDQLEIHRGELLRIKPHPAPGRPTPAPAPGSAASAPAPGRQPVNPAPVRDAAQTVAKAEGDGEADRKGQVEGEALDAAPAAQAYRATLWDDVVLEHPQVAMHADRLDVVFQVGPQADQDWLDEPPGGEPAARSAPGTPGIPGTAGIPGIPGTTTASRAPDPADSPASAPPAGTAAEPAPSAPDAALTLAPDAPDDVRITWRGKLTVRPEEDPAPRVAGGDTLLTLAGRPVRLNGPEGEELQAASLSYFLEAQRLEVAGGAGAPLVLRAPGLGTVRGTELVLDQPTGEGYVLGPGTLDAVAAGDGGEADPQAALPADLKVSWQDRLDLYFYPLDDPETRDNPDASAARNARDADAAGPAPRLASLRAAVFRGQVEVTHPQVGVRSDTLAFQLAPPGSPRRVLETLTAEGEVNLRVDSGQPEGDLAILADLLTVELQRDRRDHLRPARLLASGHDLVEARLGDQALRARLLDVRLGSADPGSDPALAAAAHIARRAGLPDGLPPAGDPRLALLWQQPAEAGAEDAPLEVTEVRAEREVYIELADPQAEIFAARLVADVPLQQVRIFGQEGEPARMVAGESTLICPEFLLDQARQVARAQGQGTLIFAGAEALALDRAADPDRRRDDAPAGTVITVRWREAMSYHLAAHQARFVGGVVSRARSGQSFSHLTADDLTLDLARAEATAPAGAEAAVGPAGRFSLQRASARGDVQFVGQSWDDPWSDLPTTRLTLRGPLVTFDYGPQQLQVVGAGSMLVEDYRPEDAPAAGEANAIPGAGAGAGAEDGPLARFSGRGKTLLTWADTMTLDAARNDLLVEGQVQMLHVAPDDTQSVQLDCRRFLADLAETGGLGGWTADHAPRPRLERVRALGQVRLISPRYELHTDRLLYEAARQRVQLLADRESGTRVLDLQNHTTLPGRAFEWDLRTNRLEAVDVGRVSVPLQ